MKNKCKRCLLDNDTCWPTSLSFACTAWVLRRIKQGYPQTAIFSLLSKLRMPFKTARLKFSRDHEKDAFDDSKIIFIANFLKMPPKTAIYSPSNILGDTLDDSRIILWRQYWGSSRVFCKRILAPQHGQPRTLCQVYFAAYSSNTRQKRRSISHPLSLTAIFPFTYLWLSADVISSSLSEWYNSK